MALVVSGEEMGWAATIDRYVKWRDTPGRKTKQSRE